MFARKFKVKLVFLEIIETIIFVLVIVLPVRYFVFEPFVIKGESMSPNFHNGDYLIAEKISLFFEKPKRFDVVIFKAPPHEEDYYIKRIIGLPGETVEIKNGKIYIYNKQNPQGLELKENFLTTQLDPNEKIKITLKNDEYFVLGDNRQASFDSRKWGPLPQKNLIGKVILKVWPLEFIKIKQSKITNEK